MKTVKTARKIEDMQVPEIEELKDSEASTIYGGAFDYDNVYHTYEEIVDELKNVGNTHF